MNGYKIFLRVSGVSIIMFGLFYGVDPRATLEGFVGLTIGDNQLQIFRAIMGLYCGVGGLLIYGAMRDDYVLLALLLETVFMGTLAAGRIISLIVDGHYHWFAVGGVLAEVPLFLLCLLLFLKARGRLRVA